MIAYYIPPPLISGPWDDDAVSVPAGMGLHSSPSATQFTDSDEERDKVCGWGGGGPTRCACTHTCTHTHTRTHAHTHALTHEVYPNQMHHWIGWLVGSPIMKITVVKCATISCHLTPPHSPHCTHTRFTCLSPPAGPLCCLATSAAGYDCLPATGEAEAAGLSGTLGLIPAHTGAPPCACGMWTVYVFISV